MSDPVTAAADGSPDPRSGMVAALAEVARDRLAEFTINDIPLAPAWALDTVASAVAAALAPMVERLVAEGRAEALAEGIQWASDGPYCSRCGRHCDWTGETSPGAPCMGCGRYRAILDEGGDR